MARPIRFFDKGDELCIHLICLGGDKHYTGKVVLSSAGFSRLTGYPGL
ncbi:hypothetical protein HMPREF9442_01683 [Paraprevotella xylaniphila YIT 11841]|uniref:Uncharacterized protein n=1 Tax=Paraprevotella xylaniphila YIT 11841 TaxID=762982 RepID=F3QU14_9BACT|nr:hypothetical protein HMPREF9442_01683 [Paraprevotella xylaniphila YIT 11841]